MTDTGYKMNPELDDLIYGTKLREGMIVRLEGNLFSSRARPEVDGWVTVTELSMPRIEHGSLVRFIAVADDNTKSSVTYNSDYAWFVRKSSIPPLDRTLRSV